MPATPALMRPPSRCCRLRRNRAPHCRRSKGPLLHSSAGGPSAATATAATLGEAALIRSDGCDPSRTAPERKLAQAVSEPWAVLAGRRAARGILPERSDLDCRVLKIPPIVVAMGQAPDQSSGATLPLPIALEPAIAAALRQQLEVLRPVAAYISATCSSDILCLEAMQELGGETHIVLPFPAEECQRVNFAHSDWGERFERR